MLGAVPSVVMITVVVEATTSSGFLPVAMPVFEALAVQDGVAAQVPLNVTVKGLAGTPELPIVTIIAESDPVTLDDVPQLAEHVGDVVGA